MVALIVNFRQIHYYWASRACNWFEWNQPNYAKKIRLFLLQQLRFHQLQFLLSYPYKES